MGAAVLDLAAASHNARIKLMLDTLDALRIEAEAGVLPEILIITRDAAKRRRIVALGDLKDDDSIVALLQRSLHDMCNET